ncbi:hypothetical protein D3C85_1792670 [compost metagenome]
MLLNEQLWVILYAIEHVRIVEQVYGIEYEYLPEFLYAIEQACVAEIVYEMPPGMSPRMTPDIGGTPLQPP